MSRKLELYGTLGPSDHDKDILKEMFHYGMTGLRLNLSHKSLTECSDWLSELYEASEELHIVPDLLVDLQGPELRIGDLTAPLQLEAGKTAFLVSQGKSSDSVLDAVPGQSSSWPDQAIHGSEQIPVIPVPNQVVPFLKMGQQILLDDGKILLNVEESEGTDPGSYIHGEGSDPGSYSHGEGSDPGSYIHGRSLIPARVLTGGTLMGRKSLALPGQSINLPTLTDKDMENLSLLSRYRVTGVMLPFVRNAEDLMALKKALLSLGNGHVRIFAKIENQAGVDQLPSLLPHCDHVVIARGDLANSVSITKLPAVQKKIAMLCRQTKTPFMVVTQMLASMEHAPVPTRAEVSDIFNAVLDGASSLMLTGETAVGRYPVEAIKVLSDVSFEALRYQMEAKFLPF